MIMADVGELASHYRTQDLSELRDCLASMDASTMPDALSLPSLAMGYLRSGDLLFTPMGHLCAEKALNDHSVSLRLGAGKNATS